MVISDSPRVGECGCGLGEREAAQAFLLRVSEELANSLDYDVTLQSVAHQAVPALADVCVIGRGGQDGRLTPVAAVHVDATMEERLRDLAVRSGARSPALAYRAFRTGKPVVLPQVSAAVLDAIAQEEHAAEDPEVRAAFREVGPSSLVAMPLIARGHVLGVMSLSRLSSSRPFSPHDVAVIEQLARLCALAMDNAGLYREAQNAVRVREELLAATSHELRTPLSEIKGFVTTLLRTDVDCDETTRRDFLLEIDREADRLDALISDLLDMSWLMSGGSQDFECDPTSPAVVVHRGLERVRLRVSNSTLDIDRGLGALPLVCVNSRRIEQVLANLIDNATKYAPGSTIHISGALVDGGQNVELYVEDEGPGIPDADLEHVFDKYYRGRSEAPGTGLGLPISRVIIEGHGGRMRAENRPGGGARFVVSLPAVRERLNGHTRAA
jgi:K+-sensing histidine kinase KdpD